MHRIGVCSWSLRPRGAADLIDGLRACGASAVQVALAPFQAGLWDADDLARRCRDAGITLLSGMMSTVGEDYTSLESIRATGGLRPDQHWPDNQRAAEQCAAIANRLGLRLVTFHAGFLPHNAGDAHRQIMLERLARIADIYGQAGIDVALETGQETPETLIALLRDLDRTTIGVNFDPANIILYGTGDPLTAFAALTPWVRQVHVKDALPAARPGVWGQEVVVGRGAVDWPAFFTLVDSRLPTVDLVIERESGEQRIADVQTARGLITRLISPVATGPGA